VNITGLSPNSLVIKDTNGFENELHRQDTILQNEKNGNANDSDFEQKNQKNIFTKTRKTVKKIENQDVSWPIRNKLIVLVIWVVVIATLASNYLNLNKIETELFKTNRERLSSLKEEKKRQIENYFDQMKKQAIIFSSNFTVVSAMEDFTMGFVNAFKESEGKLTSEYENKLRDRYRYQVKMTHGADELDLKGWYPYGKTSQILQSQYISENKYPIGEKHKLDRADGDSLYSEAHQEYHPYIRQLLETFGYYDIFLVEPETGFIVYSVYKEIDYATSLKTGPYANTPIGRAFKSALKTNDRDAVIMEDFETYAPSYNAPAAFIASPMYSGEKLTGVLIFQVSIEKIDDIMTGNHAGKGEVYLIGQDYKLRSNSRLFLDNPHHYFEQLQTLMVKPELIEKSKALNISIGINEITTPGTIAAIKGKSGFSTFNGYRGVSVLSAYSPLEILGLKWGILAELDEAEAFAMYDELRNETIMSSVIMIVLLSILGVLVSNNTAENIHKIVNAAKNIKPDN